MHSLETLKTLPKEWFDPEAIDYTTAMALITEPARVAQKCTGKSKKPVFLFPNIVVKGPWTDADTPRVARELARAKLFLRWALPTTQRAVLTPKLFVHPTTNDVYLISPPLHTPPTPSAPWIVETTCSNVSRFGPRTLEVIARQSTGVVRVSDAVRKHLDTLDQHPEIWEHLLHRFLVQAGDSGLHNMLLDPHNNCAVGIDFDENRRPTPLTPPPSWINIAFKAPPFRKARERMDTLRKGAHKTYIKTLFDHLHTVLDSSREERQKTLELHGQHLPDDLLHTRLAVAKHALLAS